MNANSYSYFAVTDFSPIQSLRQADDARALPFKQLRSEQARERFLATGTRLLAAGGFDDVSIAQIAAESGSSVGAFYQRFKNKQSFFEFLLDRVVDEVRVQTQRTLTPERTLELDLAQTILLCVSHQVQVIRAQEGLIRAALAYSINGSNDWHPIGVVGAWLNAHYIELILPKCRRRDKDAARQQLLIGLHIISGHLVNTIAHSSTVLPLNHPDLTHWLSSVVGNSLKVAAPGASIRRPSATSSKGPGARKR